MKRSSYQDPEAQALLDLFDQSENFRSAAVQSARSNSQFTRGAVQGKLQGKISFFAKADGGADVVKLASVSYDQLYAWAEPGKPALLSEVRLLSAKAVEIANLCEMGADVEEVATDFWGEVIGLHRYLGCSPQHSTAITALITLATTGANSFITKEKADSLARVLNQLGQKITITTEDLAAAFLDLTRAGFDLAAAWDFEMADFEETDG